MMEGDRCGEATLGVNQQPLSSPQCKGHSRELPDPHTPAVSRETVFKANTEDGTSVWRAGRGSGEEA